MTDRASHDPYAPARPAGRRAAAGVDAAVDVPEDADEALAMLDQDEDSPGDLAARARLVLAAELTRPPSRRRKSILARVVEVLGETEVASFVVALTDGDG